MSFSESKPTAIHSEDMLKSDLVLLDSGLQIADSEREMTLWQSARAHKRILLYSLAAFFIGTVVGYDAIANGASLAMPAFDIYFGSTTPDGKLYLKSIWTSLWSAMSALAQSIGGFGIGFVMDRFGRKWIAVAVGFVSVAGVAVQYTSTTSGSLLAGKMVNGLAVGALQTVATTWLSEIAPSRLRGVMQSGFWLFVLAMQMLGLGVIRALVLNIHPIAFRIVFIVQWPLAALVIVSFPFVPESPTYLINRGRLEDAKKSLARLYGADNSIDARFTYLLDVIRHENLGKKVEAGSYFDCFKGSNLRRTLSVIYVVSGLYICGAALLTQNIYFLIIAGLPVVHVFDVGMGGFALAIILIASSWWLLLKIGQRVIYLSAPALSAVLMFVVGGLYYAKGLGPIWVIAIILNFLIAWGAVAFQATGFAIIADLSSYKLRGKTQAIAIIFNAFLNWLFSFITPYIYNIGSGNLGARTGFVYGALSTVFFIGALFVIPDTTGMSIAEIDWMFENKVRARDFAKTSVREEAKLATVSAVRDEAVKSESTNKAETA